MRAALVHDWLTGLRGGERVLLELARLFPAAPIYTLLCRSGAVPAELERRDAGVSFLQRLPRAADRYRYLLPLFPSAIRSLRLPPADLIVSSSHAVAKGVRTPPNARHVSYIHTPMRYLWGFGGDYFSFGSGRLWKRAALQIASPYLRWFDRQTEDVDFLIANSENVRRRIEQVWRRSSTVIYPPVDTEFFHPPPEPERGDFYLVVSSLEPYKRVDLAIEAFRSLRRPLKVIGDGTLREALEKAAGPHVPFLGRISDTELRRNYQQCRALVFPAEEDFGIVPLEAQACGAPVIAYGTGGALETVVEGETGLFFSSQTASSLADAAVRFERLNWRVERIRRQAERFSRTVFRDTIAAFFTDRLGVSLPCSPGSHAAGN